ncbi:MAG: ATP-binding protein [Sedimentisphaerales bacterium]|nr:ATP-binding protein [Sedimentisphaerales bacterium]
MSRKYQPAENGTSLGEPANILTIARVLAPGEKASEIPRMDYPEVTLERWLEPVDQFLSRIRESLASKQYSTLSDGDLSISVTGQIHSPRSEFDRGFGIDWPLSNFEVCLNNKGRANTMSPLVTVAHPLFTSIGDAINHVFDMNYPDGQASWCNGYFMILVPHFLGKFTRIYLEEGKGTVSIERKVPSCLYLKGAIRNDQERQRISTKLPADVNETTFDLSLRPENGTFFLLSNEDSIVDSFEIQNFRPYRSLDILSWSEAFDPTYLSDIERIRSGENETTEFKEIVNPWDSSKLNEVMKAAAAFANTKGGVIYIGVTDECLPAGFGKPDEKKSLDKSIKKVLDRLQKEFETKNLQELASRYAAEIRKRILENIEPQLACKVEIIKIASQLILRIDIPQGNGPPYQLKSEDGFRIRAGAQSRKARSDELPALFNKESKWPNILSSI